MDPIGSALEGAREYVSGHHEEARYTDSEARAIADSSLLIGVMGPNGEEVTTDFPASVGEATASCVAALVVMRAASQGLGSIRVEVTVDSVSDDRGILGLDDAVAAGPESTRVAIKIDGTDADAGQLNDIGRWAVDHCPVTDALRRAIPLSVTVESAAA